MFVPALPRPKIPSMGYALKSSEASVADPKPSSTWKPAKATVSLATTPLTVPVPYDTFQGVSVRFNVVESWGPKVLCAWQAEDVQAEP